MLNRIRRAYVPILTQITVPYVILAVLVAAGGTYLINQVIVDSVEERFTNQLIETGVLAKDALVREQQEMLEALRLVSHMQGVGEAMINLGSSEIETLTLPIAFNAEVDTIAFVRTDGVQVSSKYLDPDAQSYLDLTTNQAYNRTEFVDRVLRGESDELGDKFVGLMDSEQGQILIVAGPVLDASGQLSGAALIGRFVENLARLVREETLGHVTLFSLEGEPIVSTLPDITLITENEAETIVTRSSEGTLQRSWQVGGVTYSELLSVMDVRAGEPLGILGIALPTHFLVQTSQITRDNTLLLMGVALLLVLAVGAVVAGRITRPIRDLKDAALKVSSGDYAVQVHGRGQDEVGVLTQTFNEMVSNLSKSKQDLLDAYDRTIEGWARALDLRDHETEGHSRRVSEMAVRLGKQMGLSDEQLSQLYRGSLLHDIGKIAVPDSILLKKGKLTAQEMEQVRLHPQHALMFMEQIEFLRPALDVPYAHHEKWDGSGYPRGLKGTEIPLLARIFAIVDVWDALTSDRPYRAAMPMMEALDEIRNGNGKHFDPEVVEAFVRMLAKMLKEAQEKT